MALCVNMDGMVILVIMVALNILQVSHGEIYKVGDSAGWTTMGNVDYKLWSATKTFKIGDVIQFEYNPQFHNVMRVTHAMYKACNASLPLESFTTGNDTVKITRRGHHFFLCGVPGHCKVGQKVDINVPRKSSSVGAGAPSPSVFVSPSVPIAAKTPSPSANSAEPLQRSYVLLVLLALVALVFCSYTLV